MRRRCYRSAMTVYANGSGKNCTRVEKMEASETSLDGNVG